MGRGGPAAQPRAAEASAKGEKKKKSPGEIPPTLGPEPSSPGTRSKGRWLLIGQAAAGRTFPPHRAPPPTRQHPKGLYHYHRYRTYHTIPGNNKRNGSSHPPACCSPRTHYTTSRNSQHHRVPLPHTRMSERGNFRGRGGSGAGGGGGGGGRGGTAQRGGGRGGSSSSAQSGAEKPKKENILDLSKYMDKAINVKFNGGREGKRRRRRRTPPPLQVSYYDDGGGGVGG